MPTKEQQKEQKEKERIRIKVRSYDSKLVDKSVKHIVEAIKRYGGRVVGPIPLPTESKDYTVNRSPFVHNKSKEQFEMKIHKRLIDVVEPEQKIIEALSNLNLPAGIDIEIKTA